MTGARSIYLFGANFTGEEAFRYCSVKLFSSKIYQGNLLVQDLIPVLDEDGIICMFNKVKKEYHYNKGTSVFKGGAKGDSPYTEVEYLQSKDGYQYIN